MRSFTSLTTVLTFASALAGTALAQDAAPNTSTDASALDALEGYEIQTRPEEAPRAIDEPVHDLLWHPCAVDEWYDRAQGRCFKMRGRCAQYDGTSRRTCQTDEDRMDCAWDRRNRECFASPRMCEDWEWYSYDHNRCFDRFGDCQQYDHTDARTCNNDLDKLSCSYDRRSGHCDETRCAPGQWYSARYDRCYAINGRCRQYDNTDPATCNSVQDNLRCEWDSANNYCDPR